MLKAFGLTMTITPSDQSPITPPPEEKPELSTTHFQSGELERIFKVIDQLRACGVSEDISLPQVLSYASLILIVYSFLTKSMRSSWLSAINPPGSLPS
jgi:hypothetical protein